MALIESRAEQSMDFKTEPAIVAEACQAAIISLGLEVKEVSRSSGTITGKSPTFTLGPEKRLFIKVSKVENATRVNVSAIKQKGLLVTSGADEFLAEFLATLSNNPTLKGKSATGW